MRDVPTVAYQTTEVPGLWAYPGTLLRSVRVLGRVPDRGQGGREDTASGASSHSPCFASPRALHLSSPFRVSATLPANLPTNPTAAASLARTTAVAATLTASNCIPASSTTPTCRFSQPGCCWLRPPWALSPPRTSRSMSLCLLSVIARLSPATKCRCITVAPLLPTGSSSMRVCHGLPPRPGFQAASMGVRLAAQAPFPPLATASPTRQSLTNTPGRLRPRNALQLQAWIRPGHQGVRLATIVRELVTYGGGADTWKTVGTKASWTCVSVRRGRLTGRATSCSPRFKSNPSPADLSLQNPHNPSREGLWPAGNGPDPCW